MKGKGFLRFSGILMIIGGAVSIILCGMIALTYVLMAIFSYNLGIVENLSGSVFYIISAILFIVGGIIELIAGIVGTGSAGKPERYKRCIVWGIIVLVIQIVSIIFSLISGNMENWTLILAIIFGVIIPLLYIIGAILNRKAALRGETSIDWKRDKLNKQMDRLDKKEVKLNQRKDKMDAARAKREAREAERAAREAEKAKREAEAKAAREAAEQAAKEAVPAPAPAVENTSGTIANTAESAADRTEQMYNSLSNSLSDTAHNADEVISDAANTLNKTE